MSDRPSYREILTAGRECLSALLTVHTDSDIVSNAIERNRPLLLGDAFAPKHKRKRPNDARPDRDAIA
jgi:hypothetical protein